MKKTSVLYLLLIAGAFSSCASAIQHNGRDATLLVAYAVSTERTNQLGAKVAPDEFVVHAEIALPKHLLWEKGDIFYASIDVGTVGNTTKYGSNSALKFTLLNKRGLWIDQVSIVTLFPDIHQYSPHPDYNYYHVKSEPLRIQCNEQNKIVYTVAGLSRDIIKLRAGTSNTITIKQGKSWLGELENYKDGVDSQAFNCGLEKQGR